MEANLSWLNNQSAQDIAGDAGFVEVFRAPPMWREGRPEVDEEGRTMWVGPYGLQAVIWGDANGFYAKFSRVPEIREVNRQAFWYAMFAAVRADNKGQR